MADANTSSSSPLDNLDVLTQILSFVGKNQFRFIAPINRRFKTAYSEIFPNETMTYLNASTEEHAKICWTEIPKSNSFLQEMLCFSAAEHDSLAALQYLRAVDCQWNETTCRIAAKKGHLSVLQWCRANGCPWNEKTCSCAAGAGQLDALIWCRENGCPWDEGTCSSAAGNGHLHILQWCRENGCPWYEWTGVYAAQNGHLNVAQWCRENGCPMV